jgi:hypothetical protein
MPAGPIEYDHRTVAGSGRAASTTLSRTSLDPHRYVDPSQRGGSWSRQAISTRKASVRPGSAAMLAE